MNAIEYITNATDIMVESMEDHLVRDDHDKSEETIDRFANDFVDNNLNRLYSNYLRPGCWLQDKYQDAVKSYQRLEAQRGEGEIYEQALQTSMSWLLNYSTQISAAEQAFEKLKQVYEDFGLNNQTWVPYYDRKKAKCEGTPVVSAVAWEQRKKLEAMGILTPVEAAVAETEAKVDAA